MNHSSRSALLLGLLTAVACGDAAPGADSGAPNTCDDLGAACITPSGAAGMRVCRNDAPACVALDASKDASVAMATMDASPEPSDAGTGPDDASSPQGDGSDASTSQEPGPCKAGYYTGGLKGKYQTPVFDPGFGTLTMVPLSSSGQKGWFSFVLDPGTQPHLLKVHSGCVIAIMDDSPFVATFEGELDCTTGALTTTLQGDWALFNDPEHTYPFSGELKGVYDIANLKVSGDWKVAEFPGANPPGGSGTWTAAYQSAQAPSLPADCVPPQP
ncbi:MAG: hypothetical protein QM778_18600 [Myxococcales bacterium]